jgi:glycosyltransferase involved in cell wall biosynthesis
LKTRRDTRHTILFFGNDWFAENRTSSHHIARWLARYYRVYYIESPGLRAPQRSGRDFKKIGVKLLRFFHGSRPTREGLKVRTLLQIPFHRFRVVKWVNRTLILLTIRWLLLRERISRPIAWFMVPHLSQVVGRLNESTSVYYCIDDYASLPGVNASAVKIMDEELTRRADVVFVASDTLLEAKQQLNPATFASPHGVDAEHFARAQDPGLSVPSDIAGLPGPVVGFFGLIERWINLGLVDYLAEQRPNWSFVLIGRVAVPDEELPRRPNIHYLGKKNYDDLPAYGRRFDAAIIPYHLNQQVYHANPIKLREYLAMGKPIVSVSTPEIDKYAEVVAIGRSNEDFLRKLDQALARPATEEEVGRRMARVAAETWDARLRRVMDVVLTQTSSALEAAMPPMGEPVSNVKEAV